MGERGGKPEASGAPLERGASAAAEDHGRGHHNNSRNGASAVEGRYRDIVEAMFDWAWEVDADLIVTYSSESVERVLGFPAIEVVGRRLVEFVAPDDLERVAPLAREIQRKREPFRDFELWGRGRDDRRVCLLSSGAPIVDAAGNFRGFRGVSRDITQRRHAEEALRASAREFRAIFDHFNDAVYIHDMSGRILEANRAACEQCGYSREELATRTVADIDAPEQHQNVPARVARVAELGHAVFESVHVRKGGVRSAVEVSSSLVKYRGTDAILSVCRDIGRRKKVEEALRESEERYRTMVTGQGEGAGFVDTAEVFLVANPAAEEVFGVPPGTLVGRNLTDFLDPANRALIESQTARRQTGERSSYEVRIVRPDGETRDLLVTATPQLDPSGEYVGAFGVFRDVTDRRRAEEVLRKRNAQLEALREVSLAITSQLELETLLRTITDRALTLFGADAGELFLHRPERDVLERVVAVGVAGSGVRRELCRGEGLAGRVWEAGKALLAGAGDTLAPESTRSGKLVLWQSILGVPIRWRDELLGVLGVLSFQPGAFMQGDVELIELFATQAAVAIINARLYTTVEHLATVDELTGAFNRRGLLDLGYREIERARRFGHALSALFIDLDRFKAINDRFSHELGDRVLREVARRIAASVRDIDVVARYGGEEFVVLLIETDARGALEVAERMRAAVAGIAVPVVGGPARVTISVGVATLRPDVTELELLVRRADQAMYLAKQAGRDRVVAWVG